MYAVHRCVKYAYKKVKAKKHSVSMFIYWGRMVCKKEQERSMISRVCLYSHGSPCIDQWHGLCIMSGCVDQ